MARDEGGAAERQKRRRQRLAVRDGEAGEGDGDLVMLWAIMPLLDAQGPLQEVALRPGVAEGAVGVPELREGDGDRVMSESE